MACIIGAEMGAIVGAVLCFVVLTILLALSGDIGAPMAPVYLWGATYLIGFVCGLHGIPIGVMVARYTHE